MNGMAFAAINFTTTSVRVTLKQFNPADEQPEPVSIPGVQLPTNCGSSRCSMALVSNAATSTAVLLVPLHEGLALIEYSRANQTLQFATHHILTLPSEIVNSCQIITFLNITEFINQRQITDITGSLPHTMGICLSENGGTNTRLISITVDFMNISKSFLSVYRDNVFSISVASPNTVSNFQYTSNIAECWMDFAQSFTSYIHDRSKIGQFDWTGINSATDYTLRHLGTSQNFYCDNPRQLVRISDQILTIYCENSSAEIDVCNLGGSSVEVTNVHQADSEMGIPYYCSSEMSSFVAVNDTTVTYGNSSVSIVSRNLPLNESVYFGNCLKDGDKVLFFCTTTLGNTYLVNLSSQDLSEEEAVLLVETGVNSATFVQHQLYFDNNIVVYNNGSSSMAMVYNVSCQNHIATIEHQYQLSLVVPSEGQHPCTCRKLTSDTGTSTTSGTTSTSTTSDTGTTSTTSDTTTQSSNGDNTGEIGGIVAGAIIGGVIIISIITIINIIIAIVIYRRSRVKNR